jgi:hypothetical protein
MGDLEDRFDQEDDAQFRELFATTVLLTPEELNNPDVKPAYNNWLESREALHNAYLSGLFDVSGTQANDLAACALKVYRARIDSLASLKRPPKLCDLEELWGACLQELQTIDGSGDSVDVFRRQRQSVDRFAIAWAATFKPNERARICKKRFERWKTSTHLAIWSQTRELFENGRMSPSRQSSRSRYSSNRTGKNKADNTSEVRNRNRRSLRANIPSTHASTSLLTRIPDHLSGIETGDNATCLVDPFGNFPSDPYPPVPMPGKMRSAYNSLEINEKALVESVGHRRAKWICTVAYSRTVIHLKVMSSHLDRRIVNDRDRHLDLSFSAKCLIDRLQRLKDEGSFVCECRRRGTEPWRHEPFKGITWDSSEHLVLMVQAMNRLEEGLKGLYETNLGQLQENTA